MNFTRINKYDSIFSGSGSNFIGDWFLKEHPDGYNLNLLTAGSYLTRRQYGSPSGTSGLDGYTVSGLYYNLEYQPFVYAYLCSGNNTSQRCGQLTCPLFKSADQYFKPSAILFISRLRVPIGGTIIPNYAMLLSAVRIDSPNQYNTTHNDPAAPYPNFGIAWVGSSEAKIFWAEEPGDYDWQSLQFDTTNKTSPWFGFYYRADTKQLYTIIDSFDYHDLQLLHTFSSNFPNALVFDFMAHAVAGSSYSRIDWNLPIVYTTKSKGW
jgi:hypothetical protein